MKLNERQREVWIGAYVAFLANLRDRGVSTTSPNVRRDAATWATKVVDGLSELYRELWLESRSVDAATTGVFNAVETVGDVLGIEES